MRFAAAAAFFAFFHGRSAESSGQLGRPWNPNNPGGQQNAVSAHLPPGVPFYLPMQQSAQGAAPLPMGMELPKSGQTMELNQQRAVLPVLGRGEPMPMPTLLPSTVTPGSVSVTNTGRAVQELHTQTHRLFQRPAGGMGGSTEVAFCVENIMNVLAQLSHLIQSVIAFCEAEKMQKGHEVFGQVGQQIHHSFNSGGSFPVDAFIKQGSEYGRRVTAQLIAMREFLAAVLAPGVTKERIGRELHRFSASTSDVKEVFQLGTQVANAAVGAVLPYVSTCSFFPKGDSHGNYKLWSLVGARVTSTLRYLYQVLEAVRAASGKLEDLVVGKIKPQSLLDFARSRPLFRAAAHLETAEARSVSAVRYFNDLAAAYNTHQQSLTARAGERDYNPPPHSPVDDFQQTASDVFPTIAPAMDDFQQTMDGDLASNLSLMAEDID